MKKAICKVLALTLILAMVFLSACTPSTEEPGSSSEGQSSSEVSSSTGESSGPESSSDPASSSSSSTSTPSQGGESSTSTGNGESSLPGTSSAGPSSSSTSTGGRSSSSSKSSKVPDPPKETGPKGTYSWNPIPVSGGGYVTGLVAHPKERDLYYIRTDVGGAYRWDKTYERWLPILDMYGSDKTAYYGVESLNVDPSNANIVFVAVGRQAQSGEILMSTDRGNTWKETGLKKYGVRMSGNGNYRWAGERLAVDPNKGSIVYYGSRQNGLWKSTNVASGGQWEQISASQVPFGSGTTSNTVDGTNKVGINFVVFDKNGGTNASGATNIIYAGVYGNGVYRSTNAGATWSLVPGSPTKPTRAAIASDGTLYVAHDSGAARIARNGTCTNISAGLQSGQYVGISVDSNNPNHVVIARHDKTYDNAVYRSTDGGNTWSLVRTTRGERPGWWPDWFYFAKTSSLVMDPFDGNRVWYTDWYGVWRTDNIAVEGRPVFKAYSKNHEELCVSALLSPPAGEAKLFSGAYDIGGFRHTNLDVISKEYIPNKANGGGHYNDTLFYAAYDANPNIIYKTASRQGDLLGAVYKSTDNGKTWTQLSSNLSNEYGGGKLAVSATDPNRLVWVPTKKAPHYSTDGGKTWHPVGGATSTSFSPDMWNEKVIIIAANKVGSNVFYIYRPGLGFWRSTDGGANFTRIDGNGIPDAAGGSWPPGTGVKAVPNQDGGVWVYNSAGLFKSTNYGSSFTKVSNVKECTALSFGKAKPGSGQPAAIYIFGKLSGDTQPENRLYRSDDMGQTWVRINDDNHKFGLLTVLEADGQVYGRVYIGTNGRGLFYGEINK